MANTSFHPDDVLVAVWQTCEYCGEPMPLRFTTERYIREVKTSCDRCTAARGYLEARKPSQEPGEATDPHASKS